MEELQAALQEAEEEKVKLAEIGQLLLNERQVAQQGEQEALEKLGASIEQNRELAAKYEEVCEQLRSMREDRDALADKADELERMKVDLEDDLQEAISRSSDVQVSATQQRSSGASASAELFGCSVSVMDVCMISAD